MRRCALIPPLVIHLPSPALFFDGSTSLYVRFLPVVGGSVCPAGIVTSRPLPPRGPVSRYWPGRSAVSPGLKGPRFIVMA